eukprot:5661539-Pleurochrysis_carterae.AAC.1
MERSTIPLRPDPASKSERPAGLNNLTGHSDSGEQRPQQASAAPRRKRGASSQARRLGASAAPCRKRGALSQA